MRDLRDDYAERLAATAVTTEAEAIEFVQIEHKQICHRNQLRRGKKVEAKRRPTIFAQLRFFARMSSIEYSANMQSDFAHNC